ncbi:hypothetical protein HMI54_009457 [Coelomomyces lativittatus]|nr:hypothetical protein HMI54_009457 [Coelomomyces lativittatus]KAJ1503609.1 hypothetical protein HMI56_002050 [Coelomomyces lativittatus]KAJ1506133.1 hypothetical protein HMI55_001297 [Coelomomyces lativittatus]
MTSSPSSLSITTGSQWTSLTKSLYQLKQECTVTPTLNSPTSKTVPSAHPVQLRSNACSSRIVTRPKYRVSRTLFPARVELRKDIEERMSEMYRQNE